MAASQWWKSKKTATSATALIAYTCISAGINLLVSIVLTSFLSEAAYGLYKFIFAVAGIFQVFLFTGLNQAVARAAAKNDDAFIYTAFQFKLRWSAPLYGICMGGAAFWYMAEGYGYDMGLTLIILGLLVPVIGAYSVHQPYIQGKKAFKTYALYGVGTETIVGLSIISALLYQPTPYILVGAYAASQLLANIFWYYRTIARYKPQSQATENHLSYGKQLTGLEIIGTVAQQIDRIILFHFWGAEVLGRYAVIQLIPQYAYTALKSTGALIMPYMVHATPKYIHRTLYRVLGALFMCGALLGGGYALCAPIIFNILFPAYKSLVAYTQFMAIDIALALPLSFMGSIFVAHKMTRAMYISNSTSSIIKIGCYIVGGVYGGIGGMIAAYIISRIIGFIINVLLLQKTISQIITIASSTEFHTALRDRIDKLKT